MNMFFSDPVSTENGRTKDPSVIRFRGSYWLYYTIWLAPTVTGIAIATSQNLVQWTPASLLPLVGIHECDGIAAPGAIVLGDRVHLFYQSYSARNFHSAAILHAWSDDGTHFTRDPSNPVICPRHEDGTPYAWSSGRAIDAEAVVIHDRLFVYYATRDPSGTTQMIGTSSAPLSPSGDYPRDRWSSLTPDGPLLHPGRPTPLDDPGWDLSWEGDCIEAPAITIRDGRVYLFYGGNYNLGPQQIGAAVSVDGVHFQRLNRGQPILTNGVPGSWNHGESGHPAILTDPGNTTHLFFQGCNPALDPPVDWHISSVPIAWHPQEGEPDLPMPAHPQTTPHPDAMNQQPRSQDPADRIAWWRDAKFGLFIHWGPVSVAGTEIGWSRDGARRGYWQGGGTVPPDRYDSLYKEFNPVAFDPKEWVETARNAGMRYVVLTTRHHDGFSLWDTKENNYKITARESPYGRDIVRLLADATRAAGLRFGAYYSQPDWLNPDAFTDHHRNYQDYIFRQVRELMSSYGRIDILWFDGLGRSAEDYGAEPMHSMVRELQPDILINIRNGLDEDFDTPEQRVGTMQVDRPWESCITLCQQWSWKPGDVMKPLDECLRVLVSTITGDGNLLLNIGPMPDGRIEPRQAVRLGEIGSWLRTHASAIYGTRGGPFRNGSWGGSTCRDHTIYIHLLSPPVGGRVHLPPLPDRIVDARHFGSATAVDFSQDDHGITLNLGPGGFSAPVTILELTTDSPVAPGQSIGLPGGIFDDVSLFGSPVETTASVTSGTAQAAHDGGWDVHSDGEPHPAVVLDLGTTRGITAFSASAASHNASDSNASLCIDLSADGSTWEEIHRSSYGLPRWEIPVTCFVAGIHHPGSPARFLRVRLDQGSATDSLRLKGIRVHAH